MTDLSPAAVQRRLEQLGELHVPETVEEARARLESERPRRQESFDEAVRRRLDEFRALWELTRALQHGRRRTPGP